MGRCLDLKSAYKQLVVSVGSRKCAVLVVLDPITVEPVYYLSAALLFGAVSSVVDFNRASRALWHTASHFGRLLLANFYDDYPGFEPKVTSNHARMTFEGILSALGWKYAAVGEPKATPFAVSFDALGVTFDVSRLHQGQFTVGNKVSRIVQLTEDVS